MKYLSPIAFIVLILFTTSCNEKNEVDISQVDNIGMYISQYSIKELSSDDPIVVIFSQDVFEEDMIGSTLEYDLLDISPRVAGETKVRDRSSVAFIPKERFVNGTEYACKVDLTKIYDDPKPKLASIPVKVKPLFSQIVIDNKDIKSEYMDIYGSIQLNDFVSDSEIESKVSFDGVSQDQISWTHERSGRRHLFSIKDLIRKETSYQVRIETNINNDKKKSKSVEVISKDKFELVDHEMRQKESQLILTFSGQLDRSQDLNRFVFIEDYNEKLKFDIKGNEVVLYLPKLGQNTQTIIVNKGIKGDRTNTEDNQRFDIAFESIKPQIKMLGQGVITPHTSAVLFPFTAGGLTAVDVEVVQVFANNMLQFLENGRLNDNYNLTPVGRIVHQEKVSLAELDDSFDPNEITRFALDLSALTQLDPASLYLVRMGMRAEYSSLDCNTTRDYEPKFNLRRSIMRYPSYGNNYDNRNDPCHASYYNSGRFIQRNILASNLGVVVKKGKNKRIHVAVSSLQDGSPLSGAEVTVYDRQKQTIVNGSSDTEGMLTLVTERNPYYVIAERGGEYSYVSLADYNANDLSNFDISGKQKKSGLDAYIFGERGVWRPGDTLFLSAIVESNNVSLPQDYPVTLKVYDSRSRLKYTQVTNNFQGNLHTWRVPTGMDDPTGNWRAVLSMGGSKFSKTLKVETVKPNRIKIETPNIASDEELKFNESYDLQALWLHGAPAANLKAKVDVQYIERSTTFDGYDSYTFDDPARQSSVDPKTVFDDNLDAEGKAKFQLKAAKGFQPPGKMRVNVKTRIYENTGEFSEDNFARNLSPYLSYVGVSVPKTRWGGSMINLEKDSTIPIVSLDAEGKPVKRNLTIGLYETRHRWWYSRSDNDVYRYASSKHERAISKSTVTTGSNGEVDWTLNKENLSIYESYLIRVCDTESGHCTGTYFYTSDYDGYPRLTSETAGNLIIESDKDEYSVGDQMNLKVQSSEGSRILVSLENNQKVIDMRWVEGQAGQTPLSIEITEEMGPNVYVHASMIQNYQHRDNDVKIRLYGIKSIKVVDESTKLNPQIKVSDILKPNEAYTVTVSEETNRTMNYVVAVVDEGLLSLTRYNTPDPWKYYNAKQALGVMTWDIYDYVLNGYGQEIERVLSVGGDAETLNNNNNRKANRFKPVVRYLGPFKLDAREKKVHQLKMDNYNGAVRVMVVATNNKAYGNTSKTVTVKDDIMLLPTAPRLIASGSAFSLPVNVFATNPKVKSVAVKVETSGNLMVDGPSVRNLEFSRIGDQLANFNIKATNAEGVGRIKVSASSGAFSSTQDIEMNVENTNPLFTQTESLSIKPGETKSLPVERAGVIGSNSGKLTISSFPDINIEDRLRYLIRYPYGCLEQTTSSAFPQLYLAEVVDLPASQERRISRNINLAINRLKKFVMADGGLSYWPGNSSYSDWSTSYAFHFLLEAKERGYLVPGYMLDGLADFQAKASKNYIRNSNRGTIFQAYRLYTLSKLGQPAWTAMNDLRESDNLDAVSAALLANAYYLAGKSDIAKDLIKKDFESRKVGPNEYDYSYGSVTRDQSMIAMAYHDIFGTDDSANLIREVANKLGSGRWFSTQTTAISLLAVGKFLKDQQKGNLQYAYQIGTGGKTSADVEKSYVQYDLDIEKNHGSTVSITNNGQMVIYANLTSKGKKAMGVFEEYSDNLSLNVKYTTMNGKPLDVSNLTQGTDFLCVASVRNPGTRQYNVQNLALDLVFPSGWEIINTRMAGAKEYGTNSSKDYQDIRDDRVFTFFGLRGKKTATFTIPLTATYVGTYVLPDAVCTSMYDNEIKARTKGKYVDVVKPNQEKPVSEE